MTQFTLDNDSLRERLKGELRSAAKPLGEDKGFKQRLLHQLLRGLLIEQLDPSCRSVNDRLFNRAYSNWRPVRQALKPLAEDLVDYYAEQTGYSPRSEPPAASAAHRLADKILAETTPVIDDASSG